MFTAAKLSLAIAYGREAFARADGLRKEIGLIPEVVRNRARDTGTRKPRNVAVQEAVNKLVARHPALTAKELWQEAPSAITDKIEFDRFRQRVTEARRKGRKKSEEHTSELQSLMRTSSAVLCLKKKKKN